MDGWFWRRESSPALRLTPLLHRLQRAWRWFVPVGAAWLPWIGAGLLLMAGVLAIKPWRLAHGGVRTEATVIENVAAVSDTGELLYRPRFVFRARNGSLVQVLSNTASFVGEDAVFSVGQVVPVVYAANDPKQAVIVWAAQIYTPAIVPGVLGVVLFDVGWVLRLVIRRRQKST